MGRAHRSVLARPRRGSRLPLSSTLGLRVAQARPAPQTPSSREANAPRGERRADLRGVLARGDLRAKIGALAPAEPDRAHTGGDRAVDVDRVRVADVDDALGRDPEPGSAPVEDA